LVLVDNEQLPNTCNKLEAKRKGAQKVSKYDHFHLLDEISRMDILEFVEDEDHIMDCSGSEGEQQSMDEEDKESDLEASES
jgi:hypothetical protein